MVEANYININKTQESEQENASKKTPHQKNIDAYNNHNMWKQ